MILSRCPAGGHRLLHRTAWLAVLALFSQTARPTADAQSSPATGSATATRTSAVGRIRGQVFDSIAMQSLPGVTVFISGTTISTTADQNGRYELADVPAGTQVISFGAPILDSLGLGTLGREVRVQPDAATTLALTTPSFRRIWSALCGAEQITGADSGITWGTVRDAATDIRQASAETRFNWYDTKVGKDKKLAFSEQNRQTRTDSTGTYYICGLPADIRISAEAAGTQSASGTVEFLIGERRLRRIDLLVSTDMVLQSIGRDRTPAESIAALRPRGSASVRGMVRDAKGVPVANATIAIGSVDSSFTTNAAGEYSAINLPAGTHVMLARQVGFAPRQMLIDLRPDSLTVTNVVITSARELEAFNVRAERVPGNDKRGFDERRMAGFGYAFEYEEFKNRPDVASILQNVPGVLLQRRRNGQKRGEVGGQGEFILVMQSIGFGTDGCSPPVYLDGRLSSVEEVSAYQINDFKAVEVYPRYFSAPPQYVGRVKCGVVLFWSRHAKW